MMAAHCHGDLAWAVAGRPLPGRLESGDDHAVVAVADGWLVTVVDGLGHGSEAAVAGRRLIDVVTHHAEEPLAALLQRCHEQLRSTRGAAVTVAHIDSAHHTLTWFGVGNVEGVLRHATTTSAPVYVTQRGGIVGYRLPALQPATLTLQDRDLLLLATDGIREGFADHPVPDVALQALADDMLARYAKPDDDALILVARWFEACTETAGVMS